MVFLYMKANSLTRVTVVREGMSVCEDGVIKQPSSVMERGHMNEEQIHIQSLARVVSEVSFGKSIHNLISPSLLRIINSVDSLFSLKEKASLPSWMEVNSGKSIHHSSFKPITLKCDTRAVTECLITKQK